MPPRSIIRPAMSRLTGITIASTAPRRTAPLGAFLAGVPLVVAAWGLVAAPTFFRPMGYRQPELFGIPLEFAITVFAIAWGAIGGYIVGTSRSRWALPYVLMFFTLPACLAIILGPAIVLILQNLG